jgi:hypothetical protein
LLVGSPFARRLLQLVGPVTQFRRLELGLGRNGG